MKRFIAFMALLFLGIALGGCESLTSAFGAAAADECIGIPVPSPGPVTAE